MAAIVRIVLIGIVAITWLGMAHANAPEGWTSDLSREDHGIVMMISPERTVTAVIGPSAKRDGRSPEAHLDDFVYAV